MPRPRPEFVELGKMLKAKRGRFAQKVMADRIGVDQRTISNFEQGRLPRTADAILDVCRKAKLDMAQVQRILMRAWGLDNEAASGHSETVRQMIRLYEQDEKFKGFVDGWIEANKLQRLIPGGMDGQ